MNKHLFSVLALPSARHLRALLAHQGGAALLIQGPRMLVHSGLGTLVIETSLLATWE